MREEIIGIRERFKQHLFAGADLSPEGHALQGLALLMNGDLVHDLEADILAFHRKFNQTYNGPPRDLPEELNWRILFMKEELEEYDKAVEECNVMKQFDALLDLTYVALGTMYLQGFPLYAGWKVVHKSNMSKTPVQNGDGKFGSTVTKGAGYIKPDKGLNELIEP
jgi:predicted HAD superfamily Cof-like phosphohydrolase